jgi:hypothetical protein
MNWVPEFASRAIKATALAMTVLVSSAFAGDVDGDSGNRPYNGDYRSGYNGYGYGLFGLGLGAGLSNNRHGIGGHGSGLGYGYGGYGNGYGSGYGYGTPAGFGNISGHSSTAGGKQAPSAPYLTDRTYEPGDGYRYQVYYNPATSQYGYYPVVR